MPSGKRALYIDTEVMFQDLELRRAGFSLLRSRLALQSAVRLLVSEVVLLESANHYRRFLEKSLVAYEKAAKDLKLWLPQLNVDVSPDKSLAAPETVEYAKRVRRTLESFDAEVVPLPNISHRRLVQRAVEKRRPFDEHGRGFNDVMIWLSLVEFLRTRDFDEVILVTNNAKDFATGGAVLDDLAQDLREAAVTTIVRHCTGIHEALRLLFGNKSAPVEALDRDKQWQNKFVNDHLQNIFESIDNAVCDDMLSVADLGSNFEVVASESALVDADTASLALVVRFYNVEMTKLRSTARWDIITEHSCDLDCRLDALVNHKTRQLIEDVEVDLVCVDRFGPATSERRERIEQ